MKALVTGATGFIGSHLVEGLIKKGYEVTCLVRRTSNLKWIEALKTSIVYGDCEDEDTLRNLTSFDYVYHLAGLTKAKKEEEFFCTNVTGTKNLVKAISAKSPPRRFIHLSSLAAVGPSRDGIPVTELTETKPVSAYGRSKLEGEIVVLSLQDKMPVTIIRPPAVYGPRDRDFYVFFRMVKKGFYPYLGKCYYSLLYVDDLVQGMILAAEAKGTAGGIYFLSDRAVCSNEDIAREISEAFDARAVRVSIPKPFMAVVVRISDKLGRGSSIINSDKLRELSYSHWTCDSSKAGRDFGFAPRVTIREGIRWTADWYRIHQWL